MTRGEHMRMESLKRPNGSVVRIASQILPLVKTHIRNQADYTTVGESRPVAPTLDGAEMQRGRRMLGLLRSTLSNPHNLHELSEGEAAAKRKAVDDRLASKLAEEKIRLEEELAREQEERRLKIEAQRKERDDTELARLEALWEKQNKDVASFRRTAVLPALCWAPAKENSTPEGQSLDSESMMEVEE